MKYAFSRFAARTIGLAALLFGAVACESDPETSPESIRLSFENELIMLDAEGGEEFVRVYTNADSWRSIDAPEWLVVTRNTESIIISAEENDSEEERSGEIAIEARLGSATKTRTIYVQQSPKGTLPGGGIFFEDPNFEQFCLDNFDLDQDGIVTPAEVLKMEGELDLSEMEFTSLAGIEYFKNLTGLSCDFCNLKSLDVSGLTRLTYLTCEDNAIESLRFEGCSKLTSIICRDNKISVISDVKTICPNIQWFDCGNNRIEKLDLSGLKELRHAYCEMNSLRELNVSNCPKLEVLPAHKNQLTKLDLSSVPNLYWLNCSNNEISALDLSKLPKLTDLDCTSNYLSALDLKANTQLTLLNCGDNRLRTLDLTSCPGLTSVDCSANRITALDFSPLRNVTSINCRANSLTTLNISGCTKVTSLTCDNTTIDRLDVSHMTLLESLVCSDNSLTQLDVSANRALGKLYCTGNKLTVIWLATGQTIADFRADDRDVVQYK